MARRVTYTSLPSTKRSKPRKKLQSRSLNAFAIAQAKEPERVKIRQHRLGDAEDDAPRRKRQRMADDDADEDEDGPSNAKRLQQKKVSKGRFDDLDLSEGSDSEGNHWTMGTLREDDDDSDIDSEEAFCSGDEERFEGFTFGGSNEGKNKKRGGSRNALGDDEQADLDEDGEDTATGDDDESLGSDAVDLATMLDDYQASDEDRGDTSERDNNNSHTREHTRSVSNKATEGEDTDGESSDTGDEEASDSSMSDEDEDEAQDPSKSRRLLSIASAHARDSSNQEKPQAEKLSLDDLLLGIDSADRKAMKPKTRDRKSSTQDEATGRLETRLPKRQQDKLDRIAANKLANETLERWVDTVKHNRRAEHLTFPLVDPDASEPMGASRFLPVTASVPQTQLESTIRNILAESGLAPTKSGQGVSEEDQIRAFEELEANKMPLEEVLARRAELRKARELLFREEVRAKRIKKIKSKSYRRVHRKERERLAEKERAALLADGVDVSEEEREENDKRRAEERMGAKHREGKWAKAVKQTGRAAWDEDARTGVTDMARRKEELLRRQQGKAVHDEVDNDIDFSTDEDEEDVGSDEDGKAERLRKQLARINGATSTGESKLSAMGFMQRAEAARKARNDEDIERMRRELAEEDGEIFQDDEEATNKTVGRKTFRPKESQTNDTARSIVRNEFEERPPSEVEDEGESEGESEGEFIGFDDAAPSKPTTAPSNGELMQRTTRNVQEGKTLTNGSSKTPKSSLVRPHKSSRATESKAAVQSSAPADADGWTTVTWRHEELESDAEQSDHENEGIDLPIPQIIDQRALNEKRVLEAFEAFGDDSAEASFATEKAGLAATEDDRVIDTTLPGWGSWVGSGLTKAQAAKNKGRKFELQKGVKPQDRKDAKLKNVIISEKKVRKNKPYLASSLPWPFTTREEYERSIRMPVGQEWNTKEVVQGNTMPRVIVKPGKVITPMEKPLL